MRLNAKINYRPHVFVPDDDVWIPQHQTVTIAGRKIAGMVYLGKRELGKYGNCIFQPCADSAIDPDLRVDNSSYYDPSEKKDVLYYLRYHEFGRDERAEYLNWLASDRATVDCHESYLRLYFYGMEHRFFSEPSTLDERQTIIAEIERLLEAYDHLNEFSRARREMSRFLYTAYAVTQPPEKIKPRFEMIGKVMALDVCIAIGNRLKNHQPVHADWCLSWYITDPLSPPLRTAAQRAFPEFRALFTQILEEMFPDGLMSSPTDHYPFSPYYEASSKAFFVNLEDHFEDPIDIYYASGSPEVIWDIVYEATEALNKYGRFLGKYPAGRERIEAYILLPQRIRPLFPNRAVEELQSWAGTVIESGDLPLIEHVVEKIEEIMPEKITRHHIIRAANTLAFLSIGMVPDPRFELRGPKMGEPVILFKLPEPVTELNEACSEYREALLCLMIGVCIAHADGRIAKEESAALEAYLRSASITDPERNRLLANLQWGLAVQPNFAEFRKYRKHVSDDALPDMGKFALCIAAADGAIHPAEIKALEKLYKAIGLPSDNIYSELHALSMPSCPKTILFADGTQNDGRTTPSSSSHEPVVLDKKHISSLMAETAQVSSLLGNIFEEDVHEDVSADSTGTTDVFAGLDAQHSAFLRELLTRQHRVKAEYNALAERFQLMPEGAMETLNEWSFDRFDDILIDEDAHYEINPGISAILCQ